jgi:predicted dehydrogenase
MTVRVALIGAGSMGNAHSNAYREICNASVAAVVDVNIERARNIALIHGAHVYASVDEMLAEETVHMVDICTPTFTHKELVIQCADRGMHVMVEKPIAQTLEEAQAMLDAVHRNNVMFMVAQVLRFWPEYAYLKQAYDKGTFGRLVQAWFSRVCSAPVPDRDGWPSDPERSRLASFELHIHDLDFIFYLLGKPSAVSSVEINLPDICASYLKTQYQYKDLPGVVIEAEGGWWQGPIPFSASFRAVFEKAVLVYEREQLTLYEAGTSGPGKFDFVGGLPGSDVITLKSTNAFFNEIDYFIECVLTNTPPAVITPDQSYAVLEILNAELRSARSGLIERRE